MTDLLPTGRAPRTYRKYGNFHDPVGLVLRMLGSANPAARGAILRAALSMGTVPIDWLLERRERRRLAAAKPTEHATPLVLVVGPPRSGSTLLYQILARCADVSYFSNLTALFPRAPITATAWLQGHNLSGGGDFNSYYGQTRGLRAPNDGFEIWNRWLGDDRYDARQSLDEQSANAMRRFFAAWTDEFRRPLLNKNNRNADCIALLADALPQATFIVIRRDPFFVAQSLIESRLRVQGAKDRPWGLASTTEHSRAVKPMGYVDDVVDQIIAIETKLQDQQSTIDAQRLVEVTYESLCSKPQDTVEKIAQNVPGLGLRKEQQRQLLYPFKVSRDLRVTAPEARQIERRIAASPLLSQQSSGRRPHEHDRDRRYSLTPARNFS